GCPTSGGCVDRSSCSGPSRARRPRSPGPARPASTPLSLAAPMCRSDRCAIRRDAMRSPFAYDVFGMQRSHFADGPRGSFSCHFRGRTEEVALASHRCHASRVDEPSMAGQQLILIVEDEKDLLDLLQFNLRQGGFDTVTAPDGEKALELLRQRIPDLVMLDLMLPGVPGIEVCRQLKSSPRTKHVP